VSLKGATKDGEMIGSVACLPDSVPSGRLTQDTVKLEFIDRDPRIARFLYWVLRTPDYRDYCAGRAMGSAVVALSRSDFLSYPVPAWTSARARLVRLLDDIEAKIELNRRMNETLEAMARALFKSWFVDFDPVRARAEGRVPAGMGAATAALFPSRLVETAEGEVPEGWTSCALGDALELKRGYDLPHGKRQAGLIPIVSSSGISGQHNDARSHGPGVVTGRYGTIGEVFYVRGDFWPLNTTLYVADFKATTPLWAFHRLRLVDFTKYSDKAAVPGVNRNHLHAERVVLPPHELQLAFARHAEFLDAYSASLSCGSVALGAVRDAHLPRLLTGELRVRDESITEAA
jgi:type I restriction enzyme S subunit